MALESDQFIGALKKSTDAAGKAASTINSTLGTIRTAMGGLVAAFTFDAIQEQTQKAFDFADAIQDLADQTGASTTFIQQFGYAAQLSGSSVDSARAAIEKFSKNLGEAIGGNKAMGDEMAKLGVTSKNVDTAIKQAATGISKLGTTAEKTAATSKLFGKAAGDLTNLMSGGASAIDDFSRRAAELGVVLGPDLISNAGKFNDEMDTLKMITDAQMAQAITKNADAIVSLHSAIADVGVSLAKFWSQNPREALSIIGGLGGALVGGLPGAIGGVVGGYAIGDKMAQKRYQRNGKWAALKKLEDDANNKAEANFLRQGAGRGTTNRFANIRNKARKDRVALEHDIDSGKVKTDMPAAPAPAVSAGGDGGSWKPTGGKGGGSGSKPKGRSGPSAQDLADKEAERRLSFERELSSLKMDELDAQQALMPNIADQSRIEHQILDAQLQQHIDEIERSVIKKDLTRAEADQLLDLEKQISLTKGKLVDQREAETLAREALAITQNSMELERDQLLATKDLARSSGERRTVSLRLVDLQYQQEKLALDAVLASKEATDAEKKIAQARLDMLPTLKNQAITAAKRDTMSPGEGFLDLIPKTGAEIKDRIEDVAVSGLNGLQQSLVDTIKGVGGLGDAFSKMSSTVIDGLINIGLQQAIIKPLGGLLFGGDSGGGGLLGSLLGSVIKGGRANGGYTSPGTYLVGERGKELLTIGSSAHVTNNDKLTRSGGGGGGINITFGSITSNDPEAIKRAAYEAVMQATPAIAEHASGLTLGKLQRRTI
ncbi:hypothetical protein [uncultured Sphingomonas sp.]|uniref:hypothetical protein n=1 Tax=uncultured Sphingomonas sp. TaxID=158754 RepID=UPI0025F79945|nr:hypothetical protein [uncultured Sphingomonas sp.]